MITTRNMLTKHAKFQLKGFTVLESLLCLFLLSLMAISLSGSVKESYQAVEERLFFLSFENLYQETQRLSVAKQKTIPLTVNQSEIGNGYAVVVVPKSVCVLGDWTIRFDQSGGNSSLAKLTFKASGQTVCYQLYLGSGKYQKTVR